MKLSLLSRDQGRMLSALWLVIVLVSTLGGVVLTSWRAQYVAQDVAWAITPLVLLWLALTLPRGVLRVGAIVVASLLCVLGSLTVAWALLAGHDLDQPEDSSFQPILRQPAIGSTLVLYRTNCGATCAYGLVLQQEWNLVPGLKAVRRLAHWYPASEAVVTALTSSAVLVNPGAKADTVRVFRYPFSW